MLYLTDFLARCFPVRFCQWKALLGNWKAKGREKSVFFFFFPALASRAGHVQALGSCLGSRFPQQWQRWCPINLSSMMLLAPVPATAASEAGGCGSQIPATSVGIWAPCWVQSLSCIRLCDPMDTMHARLLCPSLSSVRFSHSFVSDSLQPHGLQHARTPCPSPTPGVYSNSCPLSRWCHPPSHPLSSPSPSTFNLSQHHSLRIRWLKYWSFSFSHSSEYSGLISFRIDWFDLLAVQGTLKSLLQHHKFESINSLALSLLYRLLLLLLLSHFSHVRLCVTP